MVRVSLTQWQSLQFVLSDPKVTESLEMTLGFKTWPTICLGSEPRTFGFQVKAMVYWLRCWILDQGVLGSQPVNGSKLDSAVSLSRLMKWVPGTPGDLKGKRELSPRSGSILEPVEPHTQKEVIDCFFKNIFSNTNLMCLL